MEANQVTIQFYNETKKYIIFFLCLSPFIKPKLGKLHEASCFVSTYIFYVLI